MQTCSAIYLIIPLIGLSVADSMCLNLWLSSIAYNQIQRVDNAVTTSAISNCIVIGLLYRACHAIPIVSLTMTNGIHKDWSHNHLRQNSQVQCSHQAIALCTCILNCVGFYSALIVGNTIDPLIGIAVANRQIGLFHNSLWHYGEIQCSQTEAAISIFHIGCVCSASIVCSTVPCVSLAMADGYILYRWLNLWQYGQVQGSTCIASIQCVAVCTSCLVNNTLPYYRVAIADGLIQYGILTLSQYIQF